MSSLYPLFADVAGRKVVVVGGGAVAERKVQALLASKADVVVISPALTEKLVELHDRGQVEVHQRPYRPGDLADAWLVIAATGDEHVNRQVFAEAKQNRVFCNVVDEPGLCSFHVPSLVRRGDLQIAISTGGVSPALAKHLRRQLAEQFGEHYETFLEAARQLREHVKRKYPLDQSRRAEILHGFIDADGLAMLRTGQTQQFQQLLEEWKKH